jgi:hypothetical protein
MEAPTHTTIRRPSTELPVLIDQLQRELEVLEKDGEQAPEPHLYRAYLHYAYSQAWEGVSRGNLEAPRRILDGLLEVQWFAETRQPDGLGWVERAALELDFTIQSLYRACDAVEDRKVEVRLEERQSESDRQVLKVLAETWDRYLRRIDVFERLDPAARPTLARVGQILAELHHDGLLKRVFQRAQGSSQASFYALAPKGIDVCRKLGLVPESRLAALEKREPETEAETVPATVPAGILAFAHASLGPRKRWRQVAVGALANSQAPKESILDALKVAKAAASARGRDAEVLDYFTEAVCQVVLTKEAFSHVAVAQA